MHKFNSVLLAFLAILVTIAFVGILSQSTPISTSTKSTQQISVTKIQTMPNQLILCLFNNGSNDITINKIMVNGMVQTGKVFYNTLDSNLPANLTTTIVFNYPWKAGSKYEIDIVYSEGQTIVLART